MKFEKCFYLLLEVFWLIRRCNERNYEIIYLYKDYEVFIVKIENLDFICLMLMF